MDSTEISSGQWIEICRRAFEVGGGLSPGFAETVCAQLAANLGHAHGVSVAKAFVAGASELARYASQSIKGDENAVDAEREAVAASRRIVRPVLEIKLQARLDVLDEQTKGIVAPCPKCAQATESEGRRVRTWKSVLGLLSLKRRYSSCTRPDCDAGIAPSQRALGLPDGEFTARLEEVCTMMATTVPHGMATDLVEKLCGIEVSVKAMQDMTERRGAAVVAQDKAESEQLAPLLPSGLPVPEQIRPDDSLPINAAPAVAYMEIDGVVPITREELTGKELSADDRRKQRRAKERKARGGKARRYRIVGREVKNAVLYDGKDCATESPSRGCLLKKTYVSHLGDWMTFALLLWVAMLRKRFDGAKLLVVLSDGSDWIRSLAGWLPVKAFLILDLYHVKHRIFEVAHAVFGEHSPEARKWADVQGDRIEAGNARHVIEALSFLKPRGKQTRKLVDDLSGYLTNNLDRMKYPEYRAQGLRISSAAVESANFHVSGTRLKLQGMRWSADGAAQMAVLRTDLFNGRWEERTRRLLAA
jgi:hypothetical protein